MAKLTQKKCETIKPKKVVKEYADGTVAGLNLAVQVSGSKAWFLRYRHAGRTRKMRLGSFPEIPLAKARQMADEALSTIRSGIDPADAKLVAKAVDVGQRPPAKLIIKDRVEDVVRQYLTFHVHGLDSEGLPKNSAPTLKKPSRGTLLPSLASLLAAAYRKLIVPKFMKLCLIRWSQKVAALPPIVCLARCKDFVHLLLNVAT